MNTKLIGAFGEQTAARFLRYEGYTIYSGNYKTNVGEIDIVAEKDNIICFVEVKTRKESRRCMLLYEEKKKQAFSYEQCYQGNWENSAIFDYLWKQRNEIKKAQVSY